MIWDLASVKTFLGVTGTADDAKVQTAMDSAMNWAEKYCNRQFLYARETVKYYDAHYMTLPIPRYPVATIHSVSGVSKYHVHKVAGLLKFDHAAFSHEITVDYEGGFNPLPDDLVLALMQVAQSLYASMTSGGAATTGGAIKAITSDGARIEYDVSGHAATGVDSKTGMPTVAVNILDMYRRELA